MKAIACAMTLTFTAIATLPAADRASQSGELQSEFEREYEEFLPEFEPELSDRQLDAKYDYLVEARRVRTYGSQIMPGAWVSYGVYDTYSEAEQVADMLSGRLESRITPLLPADPELNMDFWYGF